MTQMPQRVEGSIHTVQIVGKEWFKMGRKIGFWVLSFWMGAVAVTFLMAPIQSSGTDGVTFFQASLWLLCGAQSQSSAHCLLLRNMIQLISAGAGAF